MDIQKKYVIYELSPIMGSKQLVLERIEFKSFWTSNSFDTKEEVIEALIRDDRTYQDYVILEQIYLRS